MGHKGAWSWRGPFKRAVHSHVCSRFSCQRRGSNPVRAEPGETRPGPARRPRRRGSLSVMSRDCVFRSGRCLPVRAHTARDRERRKVCDFGLPFSSQASRDRNGTVSEEPRTPQTPPPRQPRAGCRDNKVPGCGTYMLALRAHARLSVRFSQTLQSAPRDPSRSRLLHAEVLHCQIDGEAPQSGEQQHIRSQHQHIKGRLHVA